MEHPAWVHQYRHMITKLVSKGHEIKVVAINKDVTLELLNNYHIPYELISNSAGNNLIEKGFIFLEMTIKIFLISFKFKPDVFLGRSSPVMAINSFLFRKPHIVFEDTEQSHFCLNTCKIFSSVIITPNCFLDSLGKKQIRVNAYKELFYLWPSYFKPDPSILSDIGLTTNDTFIIVRFVSWTAHHDIGQHGVDDKVKLVKTLEQYGRVLITSEGSLPDELKPYQIKVPVEKIHDLLWYATLYVGEGATMAVEAAVLGTPAIYISTFARTMGNFIDLEDTYGLLFNYTDTAKATDKALEVLRDPESKTKYKNKLELLLKDKIDMTAFMVWFIENYPGSLKKIKAHPDILNAYYNIK